MIIEDCPNLGTNWESPQSIEVAKKSIEVAKVVVEHY